MGKARTEQLQQIAYELELSFSEKDEWGQLNLLKGFKLFRRGGRKRIYNLISQKSPFNNQIIQIFDYHYTISTGKTSQTYKQTVFFVQSKELSLPEFWMKPEHVFHKIGNWLGIEDIDFEEHPEFSKQYYLKGEDEELVRDAFNNYVIHFFTIEKEWSLEGVGYYFIFYKHNTRIAPAAIKAFYQQGLDLLSRLKN